jgi:purine-cytosine permease-like protein
MNSALFYISSVLCFGYSAVNSLNCVVFNVNAQGVGLLSHILAWVSPLAFVIIGILFMRKYKNSLLENETVGFDKPGVVSVIGIIAFIIGLTWSASELRWIMDVSRMTSKLDISDLDRALAPLVLLVTGVYFGFFYARHRLTSH